MTDRDDETPPERHASGNTSLAKLGPLRETTVRLPRSGVSYAIMQPADLDRLLDAVVHDPEQNLPHWAELWPSGIALADAILEAPTLLAGKRVLELGCGLGVTAIAALRSGANLTIADYAAESLLLSRYNTRVNAHLEPAQSVQLNWRAPDERFLADAGHGYDVLLAADVLYETRDIYPLVDFVPRIVAPDGLLWLAEPGRGVARRFIEIMQERGWQIESEDHDGPWPDPRDEDVVVAVHRLRR